MSVLVAGIGNVFLGDDGFGVEVAQRLSRERFDAAVEVADFGIRGVHLAFELASGRYDAAILVDAVSRGAAPGTLFAIEPDLAGAARTDAVADAHTLTPDAVLAWVRHVGACPPRILIVGCEPENVEESMGLSPPVAASIDGAIAMIRGLVAQMSQVSTGTERPPSGGPCQSG
ncbi:MAG TPA: hydrogenase maturation protease [Vicinamibacterales bacterium]|jgi:hydrogenase maturation protease